MTQLRPTLGRLFVLMFLVLTLTGCTRLKEIFAPSAPSSPPSSPVKKEPSPPPAVLSPQLSPTEKDRLRQQADTRIKSTERIVKQIDPKRLAKDQQDTLSIVQSFLARGKAALFHKEFQQAFNLADKAYVLAEELLNTAR